MKIKKLLIGMTAAAMAATCLSMSASATKLQDVLDPSSEDYYKVGGAGFYMGRGWVWNQSDWVTIAEDGMFEVDYDISSVLAMSSQNTLGSFGIMINGFPADNYPYTIDVQEASFTPTDGDPIEFTSLLGVQDIEESAEGGIRFVLRIDDEVDATTGEVKTAACPELAGYESWIGELDDAGAITAPGDFPGGKLHFKIDLTPEETADTEEPTPEPETPDSEEPAPETPDSTEPESQAPSDSTAAQTPSANPESGASAGIALAGIAVAAAALAVSKRK